MNGLMTPEFAPGLNTAALTPELVDATIGEMESQFDGVQLPDMVGHVALGGDIFRIDFGKITPESYTLGSDGAPVAILTGEDARAIGSSYHFIDRSAEAGLHAFAADQQRRMQQELIDKGENKEDEGEGEDQYPPKAA